MTDGICEVSQAHVQEIQERLVQIMRREPAFAQTELRRAAQEILWEIARRGYAIDSMTSQYAATIFFRVLHKGHLLFGAMHPHQCAYCRGTLRFEEANLEDLYRAYQRS